MSNTLKKMLSSVSVASLVLTGTMAANADPMSSQSILSTQDRQVVQGQDQTQFSNRKSLENRINGGGSGDHAASQQRNRNRYQHREQKRSGGQSMGQSGNRMQGSGGASSGGRMAGKGGGGGRR